MFNNGRKKLPRIQMPLFASFSLLSNSLKESTVNTFLGPDAIWFSSDVSASFPIPKTKTAAPLLWSREEAISRGVYTPWSAVCLPAVMTKTGYKPKGKHNISITCAFLRKEKRN